MRQVAKPFTSPIYGNCLTGDKIDVSGDRAKQFEEAGFLVPEGKEIKPEKGSKAETKPYKEAPKKEKAKK